MGVLHACLWAYSEGWHLCPSTAKPASQPSNEVSAEIWRPGLKSDKHILLLQKCWRAGGALCSGLGQERKQTAGYLAQTSRHCAKASVATLKQGNHKPNARPGKHQQSCLVWERQPPHLDPGSTGRGEQRALQISRNHQSWDLHSALGLQRPPLPKTPKLPT